MVTDMRPFSIVEDSGFKKLLNVLEPRYDIPSRQYFSSHIIPRQYEKAKEELSKQLVGKTPAFTADSWTSCATESYTTYTAHFLDDQWILRSYVLDTVEDSCHTADNLAEITKTVFDKWNLNSDADAWIPVITTDNARNVVNSVALSDLRHVACLAHSLNLSTSKALKLVPVTRLLKRIRTVVAYFHRSAKATTAFRKAQVDLALPQHKLIKDVTTRWNSSMDMLERFLEQQAAVYSVLALKYHRDLLAQLERTDELEIERMVAVLKPMKKITTVISSERNPACSMVLPVKEMLHKHTRVDDGDSPLIVSMKEAMWEDFSDRLADIETMTVKILAW